MIVQRYNASAGAPDDLGVFLPVIVCDACEQRVHHDGGAWWIWGATGERAGKVWHSHRGECGFELDRRLTELAEADADAAALVCDTDLAEWLEHLRANFTLARGSSRGRRMTGARTQGGIAK